MVAFANGQVRRYSADFSSYTELAFPEPIEFFIARAFGSNTTLSNGSTVLVSGRVLISRSNNSTTVRDYDYYSYLNE